jgi:hypothetical protein
VASLEKMAALDVEILALAHQHILTGEDAGAYLKDFLFATRSFKKRIEEYLDRFNGDREKTVEAMAAEDYDDTVQIQQDKKSFLLNLEAKVRVVADGR